MIALTQEQRQKRIDWLKQRISSMEQCRDEIPFGLSEDKTMELAAYRDSLASLTAENFHWPNGCNESIPKALRYLAENDRPSSGNSSFNTEHLYDIAREFELAVSNHFFTAPPIPEIKGHQIREMVSEITDTATKYQGCQCLRDAISKVVIKRLNGLGE